jgi:hypothetical protein
VAQTLPDLTRPAELEPFIAKLRIRYQAMHDRYCQLRHIEIITEEELSPTGEVRSTHERREEVWFKGGGEQRRAVAVDSDADNERVIPVSPPVTKTIYPFYAEDKPGYYSYSFAGFAEREGEVLARIEFTPNHPIDHKMRGSVWADPWTAQPRYFDGHLAKTPPFVDAFRMVAEYALSENGEFQLRRMLTEGAGGFALVRKHFRKDFRYQDYHPTP